MKILPFPGPKKPPPSSSQSGVLLYIRTEKKKPSLPPVGKRKAGENTLVMNRSRSAEINPQPNILREEGNRRKKKQTLGEKKGECHGVVGATAVGLACVSASSGGTVKRGGWRGFPLLFFSSLPQAIIVSKRMGRKRRRQKKKRKPSLPPPFPCISPPQ